MGVGAILEFSNPCRRPSANAWSAPCAKTCRTKPLSPPKCQLAYAHLSPAHLGDKSFYYRRGCVPHLQDTGYKGENAFSNCRHHDGPSHPPRRAPTVVIARTPVSSAWSPVVDRAWRYLDGDTTIEEIVEIHVIWTSGLHMLAGESLSAPVLTIRWCHVSSMLQIKAGSLPSLFLGVLPPNGIASFRQCCGTELPWWGR